MTTAARNVDTTTFVVIGDGLAAGAGDFGLSEELQPFSFPAQIAQRLKTSERTLYHKMRAYGLGRSGALGEVEAQMTATLGSL